jgi:hypothetical protein
VRAVPDPGASTKGWAQDWRLGPLRRPLGWLVDSLVDTLTTLAGGSGPWTAALALDKQGRYGAAAEAYADAAVGFEREVGRDHLWTAEALARLGRCYLRLGRPADAVAPVSEALRMVVELLPAEDPVVTEYSRLKDEAVGM